MAQKVVKDEKRKRERAEHTPKSQKSTPTLTTASTQANPPTLAASRLPMTPTPQLSAKAMKANAQVMGWRTKAWVRLLIEEAVEGAKCVVGSMRCMMSAGL